VTCANQYIIRWKKSFCFSTKRLRFAACRFSLTLRWNNRVEVKRRSDALLKFLIKIRLKREPNFMQACTANQHGAITPSWLPKVLSWLRQNALCLSQLAFSNFIPYVINLGYLNRALNNPAQELRFYGWQNLYINIEKLEMNVLSKTSPCWFNSYLKESRIREPDFLDISRVMKTITKLSYVIGYQ